MELKEAIEILEECVEYDTFGRSVKSRNNKLDNKCFKALETVLQAFPREATEKKVMEYNSKSKIIEGNIFLTPLETMILETLIKMKDTPIQPKEMQRIIFNKYGVGITQNNIKVHVCRINKKTKGLIKHRRCFGYYIGKEIKNK